MLVTVQVCTSFSKLLQAFATFLFYCNIYFTCADNLSTANVPLQTGSSITERLSVFVDVVCQIFFYFPCQKSEVL